MKLTSIAAALVLTACSTVISAALPVKPAHCPSVDSIRSGKFHNYQGTSHGWIAYQIASFETSEQWIFAMGYFNSSNLKDANDYLQKVTGSPTPMPKDDHTGWSCEYSVPGSYLGAFAVTMPSNSAAHLSLQSPLLKGQ